MVENECLGSGAELEPESNSHCEKIINILALTSEVLMNLCPWFCVHMGEATKTE